MVLREQNVFRFYVTVHHAFSMGVVQRIADLGQDPRCIPERQRTLAYDSVAEDSPSTNGMTK